MTRVICVASAKGGVGKTTLSANLAAALTEFGRDVVVVDANLTTPNLGIHLGVPLHPNTLHDVLKGKVNVHEAMHHHPAGFRVIPAGIGVHDLRGVDPKDLSNSIIDLLGHAEIVLLDVSAGLGREALAAMETSDEAILVTTPDLPAVLDALKAHKLATQVGTKVLGVVVNRINGMSHEMSRSEIIHMTELPILAEIPEDMCIPASIAMRTPIVHSKPKSKPAQEMKRLAGWLVGYPYQIQQPWYMKMFGL
ncbi:MAG: cell division ATPase MinD [Candidatus Aenigmatarchaeota archaeon]